MGKKWPAVIVLAPILCFGQGFNNLRATAKGDLYFLSGGQPFGLHSTAAGSHLFVKDMAGIRPFPGGDGVWEFEMSADAGVLALYRGDETAIVNGNGDEWLRVKGRVRLSPNGRYAAVYEGEVISLWDVMERRILQRLEKATLLAGTVVSSNGAVLAADVEKQVVLLSRDAVTVVRFPSAPLNPGPLDRTFYLDENARTVLMAYRSQLFVQVLAQGNTIVMPIFGDVKRILRYDGLSLDYMRDGMVLRVYFDGRPGETVYEKSGLSEVAAVHAGRFYLCGHFFSGGDILLDYDVSGRKETEVAAMAFLRSLATATPGSLYSLDLVMQRPLREASATPPYPTVLRGVQVLLDGKPAPLVSITQPVTLSAAPSVGVLSRIDFLVPWSLPLAGDVTSVNLALMAEDTTYFAPLPVRLSILKYSPRFERTLQRCDTTSEYYLRARRADGSGVSLENPAIPGERITVEMHGLGPVTGQAPDDRLPAEGLPIAGTLACQISSGWESGTAAVEAALLSTAKPGIYDVTLRLPVTQSAGEFYVSCEIGGGGDAGAVPVRRTE